MKEVFKALSDETRRKILELLKEKDMTAGEIAEHFNISKPSISQHLKILKYAGLIFDQKEGQYVYYSLNASVFEEVISWMMNLRDKENSYVERDVKEH